MPTNGLPPLALGRILRTVAWIIPLLLLNKGGNAGGGAFFAILAIMAVTGAGGEIATLPQIARTIEPVRPLASAFDAGHARYRAAQTAIKDLT